MSTSLPIDQAQGLRRLFAHSQVRFVPVVSNPHLRSGGLMLERLCGAFSARGVRTLVVDASERAGKPSEMALLDFAECIEPLSPQVAYVAARGLPMAFVNAVGSSHDFLQTVAQAAPGTQVVLLHAPAADLCRLFGRGSRGADAVPLCPLLLAGDHAASVTHAFASMKLLAQRAGLMVQELMLGLADASPRAERIAMQMALCAQDFAGAVLRDWLRVDPAAGAAAAPTPALRYWAQQRLRGDDHDGLAPAAEVFGRGHAPPPTGTRFAASNWAFA
ncbi:MAG: flagellar biosynthesis protein [Rhizobacter sp.]